MAGGDRIAREELAALESRGLLRRLEAIESPAGVEVRIDGEQLVSFSSNDYLGLAAHPQVRAALAEGAARWGVGAGASRLVTGDFTPHRELEAELADLEGAEAAVLFGSGYAANCGIIPSLVGPGDDVFSDALNHRSLIDGCRLSRARVHVFPHLDLGALAAGLGAASGRRKLVVTDAIFSMDGDVADLRAIDALCRRHGAMLLVDEAHATGVVGPSGLSAALGVDPDVRMGTLSKAAGAVGAFAAASRALCALFVNRAAPLVFSTALPPALACAALAAVRILRGPEGDERRARLRERCARFAAGLRALGLDARGETPIFPVVLGAPERALAAAAALRAEGLLVKPIRPPTVPAGTSRLRFALSADHSPEHIERALSALRRIL